MAFPSDECFVKVGYIFKDTMRSYVTFAPSDFATVNDQYRFVLNARAANDKFLYDILTTVQKEFLYQELDAACAFIDLSTDPLATMCGENYKK